MGTSHLFEVPFFASAQTRYTTARPQTYLAYAPGGARQRSSNTPWRVRGHRGGVVVFGFRPKSLPCFTITKTIGLLSLPACEESAKKWGQDEDISAALSATKSPYTEDSQKRILRNRLGGSDLERRARGFAESASRDTKRGNRYPPCVTPDISVFSAP